MQLNSEDNYIGLDFEATRARLNKLLASAFPQWSDFESPTWNNVLRDMFAHVADVLDFYIQAQARETRLATAVQPENVLAHARMLGYRPRGATAAKARVIFTLPRGHHADVVLPAGMVVQTADVTPPLRFQLLAPVRIGARSSLAEGVGEVEASDSHMQVIDTTGLPSLAVVLGRAPYLDGSARVQAASGLVFAARENLLDSSGSDPHFVTVIGADGRAMLHFGDGTLGAPPSGRLDIYYKTGGGGAGNVAAGTIVVCEAPALDVHGQPVQISVTNPAAASGGAARESLESIRRNAPLSRRVVERTVTREDFEIQACQVPGVARALMLTADTDPQARIHENRGILFIVPEGGGPLSGALEQAVLHQVTVACPQPLTFQVTVQTAAYKRINVEVEIELVDDTHVQGGIGNVAPRDDVGARIAASLALMFAITNPDGTPNQGIGFGFYAGKRDSAGDVPWSSVVQAIAAVPDVRKVARVALNGKQQDVPLDAFEFPVLGDVVVHTQDRA